MYFPSVFSPYSGFSRTSSCCGISEHWSYFCVSLSALLFFQWGFVSSQFLSLRAAVAPAGSWASFCQKCFPWSSQQRTGIESMWPIICVIAVGKDSLTGLTYVPCSTLNCVRSQLAHHWAGSPVSIRVHDSGVQKVDTGEATKKAVFTPDLLGLCPRK